MDRVDNCALSGVGEGDAPPDGAPCGPVWSAGHPWEDEEEPPFDGDEVACVDGNEYIMPWNEPGGIGSSPSPAKPAKGGSAPAKPEPMQATTTSLVQRVWSWYVGADSIGPLGGLTKEAASAEGSGGPRPGGPLCDGASRANCLSSNMAPVAGATCTWLGACKGVDKAGRQLYERARVGELTVCLGDVVRLQSLTTQLGVVQCLYQLPDSDHKRVQVAELMWGTDTVLGDAASDAEVFLTKNMLRYDLDQVVGTQAARQLQRPWDHAARLQHLREDEDMRRAHQVGRLAPPYFYRSLYVPEQGMFCGLPSPSSQAAQLGSFVGKAAGPPKPAPLPAAAGFIKGGVQYRPGDVVLLQPGAFIGKAVLEAEEEEEEEAAADPCDSDDDDFVALPKKRAPAMPRTGATSKRGKSGAGTSGRKQLPKGSLEGVHACCVGQLLAVTARGGAPVSIKVRRFFRPEDIDTATAYKADWWDVYTSSVAHQLPTSDVLAKAAIVVAEEAAAGNAPAAAARARRGGDPTAAYTFVVVGIYDPAKPADQAMGPVPAEWAAAMAPVASVGAAAQAVGRTALEPAKREGPASREGSRRQANNDNSSSGSVNSSGAVHPALGRADDGHDVRLATMDIFAGCGGLSEGLRQAGVADARWAIEYEAPAAEAFRLNHPGAAVFCDNCNVILRAAMARAGLADDCHAAEECVALANAMAADKAARLPKPGEVDFICGGPPCQGYSGMNRFNKGNWSMVQNSMVMAFLSFADFYRPKYFLLENVRDFVSHDNSSTFRLTLRCLLDCGYQVRFGILNAGSFGVPQSRTRTFIWASAPGCALPEWPAPLHAFPPSHLSISLPGGRAYTAVPQLSGAPLRSVTVRDAIYDLPPLLNGSQRQTMAYDKPPTSAFQRSIRGGAAELRDHVCKEMCALNLERCRYIPKLTPGADWRVLEAVVAANPSKALFRGEPLVPACLPNTAGRHNGWRGLFGRLDPEGYFPTATTDPQPMGKVGQVFHPEQDRIVSVRECARSQGFPDHFAFAGNVRAKHRQVGNAVPPPLAAALGRQLRVVLTAAAETAERRDVRAAASDGR